LYSDHGTGWYNGQNGQPLEDFYANQTPRFRWRLQTKGAVPDSKSKNYLEQTQVLADYVKNQVFRGQSLPGEYETALEELEAQKAAIADLMTEYLPNNEPNPNYDWQEATKRLVKLQLNKMTRRTIPEAQYSTITNLAVKGERQLEDTYDWTISCSSDGALVRVGSFGSGGARVLNWDPVSSYSSIGVVLSR